MFFRGHLVSGYGNYFPVFRFYVRNGCVKKQRKIVLELGPVSGYLRVRCGTESLSPRYYKVGVCEYISGGKRAPRRPDPDDDYSGVRNPAPVVASSDDGEKRCAGGGCARKRAAEKE